MNKRTSLSVLGLVAIAVAIFAIVQSNRGNNRRNDRFVIAALLPLTGGAAELGEDQKAGIEMAVEEINSKGGVQGRKIEVVYEDSRNNPKDAVLALNKIVATQSPQALLTTMSSVSLAIPPIINKAKIPTLSIAANPKVVKGSEYIFRVLPSATSQVALLSDYLKKRGSHNKVAVLYVHDDFGEGYYTALKNMADSSDISIVAVETFDRTEASYRQQISKLMSADLNCVAVFGYEQNLGRVLTQLREQGYKGLTIGCIELGYPAVLNHAREAANDVIFPALQFEPLRSTDPRVKHIVEHTRAERKKDPSIDVFLAYDEVNILAHITGQGGFAPERIWNGLKEMRNFQGIVGTLTMSPSREIEFPLVLRTVKDGKVVDLEQ